MVLTEQKFSEKKSQSHQINIYIYRNGIKFKYTECCSVPRFTDSIQALGASFILSDVAQGRRTLGRRPGFQEMRVSAGSTERRHYQLVSSFHCYEEIFTHSSLGRYNLLRGQTEPTYPSQVLTFHLCITCWDSPSLTNRYDHQDPGQFGDRDDGSWLYLLVSWNALTHCWGKLIAVIPF